MIEAIVILGATGDLAQRYLLPGLAHLVAAGELADPVRIVAVGRRQLDTEAYRALVGPALDARAASVDQAARARLLERVEYRPAQVDDPAALRGAIGDGPVAVYLALPPATFEPAIVGLAEAGLHPETRLVVEKPFGEDRRSAVRLNALLHRMLAERNVFRIDHFLHHQTVANILGIRFANRLFEPIWRAEHVDRVDVVWDETVALEGRAGYYDRSGALRDMIQNHLLQLLALIAMEAPARMDERDLRDQKVAVLRAVRTMSPGEVAERTVRARYVAGTVEGRAVPNYADEPGVDADRSTETYASVELAIDNWRWAGVPFRLTTGKAMGRARRSVDVRFRPVPHLAFGQTDEPRPNSLRLELTPDRIVLGLAVNGPGDPFDLEPVDLDVRLAPQPLPAYARLLLDVFRGDPTLSIRDDEAEECWRIVEPILGSWRAGAPPLETYAAGSTGPREPRPEPS